MSNNNTNSNNGGGYNTNPHNQNNDHDWKDTVREKVATVTEDIVEDVKDFAVEVKEDVVDLAQNARSQYEAIPTGRKMELNHWVSLIVVAAVAVIIGAVIGWSRGHEKGAMMQNGHMSMAEMMEQMSASMDGLSGSDLEQEFISQMIVHHEGAIDMSTKLVGGSGVTNDQLRGMAAGIIRAQSAEIEQLKAWQK